MSSVLAVISVSLFACEEASREMLSPRVAQPAATANVADMPDAAKHAAARSRGPLVEPDSWKLVTAEEDPFSDRLPDASCPDGTHLPELLGGEPVYSVDTGGCSYITARQPALRDISDGETLVARVWHFALNASESAEAHVALRIADMTVLDQTVPIPSEGGLIAVEVAASSAFEAGTPIFFHLHNHGDNSWSLVELSAGPKP